jgi:hypothetical protein
VAEFLDRHFPTHHLWKGELSFGEVVCVWLVFLTCQGDHRLYHLLPWVEEPCPYPHHLYTEGHFLLRFPRSSAIIEPCPSQGV